MFKDNNYIAKPKELKVVGNMVLTITTKSKLLEMVAFKEKEPWKMKIVVDWIEEKKFEKSFEITIQEI